MSNKQLSGFSQPFVLVVSFNYTTPKFNTSSSAFKTLSWITRDWRLGGVLRYQSGALIRVPASNNGLLTQLAIGAANNPALWGGGTTYWNRVPGQPLFLVDPNGHNWDATKQLVLNPAAWTDAPAGQYGTSAPYYNDYRWQRQPSESLSLGRIFALKEGSGATFQVRIELNNVFNRFFLSAPTATNPAAATFNLNPGGALSSGYGFVNTFGGAGTRPRTGQLVARINF